MITATFAKCFPKNLPPRIKRCINGDLQNQRRRIGMFSDLIKLLPDFQQHILKHIFTGPGIPQNPPGSAASIPEAAEPELRIVDGGPVNGGWERPFS